MDGLYVASMALFDEKGNLNKDESRRLMERHVKEGASGFFVAGSSGECFLMRREERITLFELHAEYLEKADLFAHVGALSTEEAIYYAKAAKEIGYKKIAATPPFYYGYKPKEIAEYYYEIAKAVDMPVLYYNIPMNTFKQIDFNHPDIISLFQSGAISGVKHTNLDLYEMERIHNLNLDMKIYGGFENEMVSFLAMGCDGFIGSTFNFMLTHYRKIYDAYLSGENKKARELQNKANNIMQALFQVGLFPGIKHILNRQGIQAGVMRKPFLELTQKEKEYLEKIVEENLS